MTINQCPMCKHLTRGGCKAFPNGIPNEYWISSGDPETDADYSSYGKRTAHIKIDPRQVGDYLFEMKEYKKG